MSETYYEAMGSPANCGQRVITTTVPAGGQTTTCLHTEYIDGFGRVYQTVDSAPANDNNNVMTSFTNRGEVASVTAPFYTSQAGWRLMSILALNLTSSITRCTAQKSAAPRRRFGQPS